MDICKSNNSKIFNMKERRGSAVEAYVNMKEYYYEFVSLSFTLIFRKAFPCVSSQSDLDIKLAFVKNDLTYSKFDHF